MVDTYMVSGINCTQCGRSVTIELPKLVARGDALNQECTNCGFKGQLEFIN